MPALSALDAIGPAVQRTRSFLFQPFRLSTYLKLSLVAIITEGCGANFNVTTPTFPTSSHSHFIAPAPLHSTAAPFHFTPAIITLIAVGAVACLLIAFLLFYLVTRLRFAYFHCLVHNTRHIRPGWRLYRTQANRFFWLNIVVSMFLLLFAILLALPFIAGFWKLFHLTPHGSQPNAGVVLTLFLTAIPVLFLFAIIAFCTQVILRDFMLPHYALESATATQAWQAAWARIRAEKMPFFIYALLRLIIPIAAAIALFLVLIIPTLIIALVAIFLGIGVHSAILAAGAAKLTAILVDVLIGVIAFAILFLIGIAVGGPLSTAIRQYALVFYGARYPQLGTLLYPSPPESLTFPQATG
jgi:hypothetical protein